MKCANIIRDLWCRCIVIKRRNKATSLVNSRPETEKGHFVSVPFPIRKNGPFHFGNRFVSETDRNRASTKISHISGLN